MQLYMQNKIYVHILPYFPASPMQYVQYISNKWYQSRHHYWYQNQILPDKKQGQRRYCRYHKNEQKYSLDYSYWKWCDHYLVLPCFLISTNIPAGSPECCQYHGQQSDHPCYSRPVHILCSFLVQILNISQYFQPIHF